MTDIEAAQASAERDRADAEKLRAETHKLIAEASKLIAEGAKYNRDRWVVPLVAIIGLLGVLVGAVLKGL